MSDIKPASISCVAQPSDSIYHSQQLSNKSNEDIETLLYYVNNKQTIDEMFDGISCYKLFKDDLLEEINEYNIDLLDELAKCRKNK